MDQVVEIRRILQAELPWDILGVPQASTPEQCTRVFQKKSAMVHPDKCAHPLATEAFKKLCEAHQGWGLNREEWQAEQLALAAAALDRQRAQEWERQGGRIHWWVHTEGIERLYLEVEEGVLFIRGTEEAEWLKLQLMMHEGSEGHSLSQRPSQRLYCVCRKPENRKEYWIQCMECKEWYHPKCVGTTRAEYEQARSTGMGWRCPKCEGDDAMDLG